MASEVANGWKSLLDVSIKRSRKVRGGNYVQIATVDLEGNPHCRTVVFRGFSTIQGKKYLRMITDGRSQKAKHVANNPKCEMCWWFQKVKLLSFFSPSLCKSKQTIQKAKKGKASFLLLPNKAIPKQILRCTQLSSHD